MNKTRLFTLLALSLTLLSACTGTEDQATTIRYVALASEGPKATLSAVDLGTASSSAPDTAVPGAVSLESFGGGQKLAVLYRDHLEQRGADLQTPASNPSSNAFPNPDNFTPCYVRLVSSAARDRLAALSDCGQGGTQDIVVWRTDGTLAFKVTLPPPTPSTPQQTRYVVQGDIVWAVHPATATGSSELIRAVRNADNTVTVNVPVQLPNVYDLTYYHNQLYAATDQGVQTLDDKGNLTAVTGQPLLGNRADRLYSDDRLLVAWRNSGSAEPLYVWNGSKVASAGNAASLNALTIAPDGTFAALQGGSLVTYDSVSGFERAAWNVQTSRYLSGGGSALTWLVP